MGQGTESCGGYEVPYEPHNDAFEEGKWLQSDGSLISISDMTTSHLRNAIRISEAKAECATFSSDADDWMDIASAMRDELSDRNELPFHIAVYTDPSVKQKQRGSKISMICHCGKQYDVRVSDVKRGYGKSCCKRCAAIKRDYGRKDPRCAETGLTYQKVRKALIAGR